MKISSKPLPRNKHTVTPYILVKGAAQFIDFLKVAFDAHEFGRVENPDGKIGHAEVQVGDSTLMIVDSYEKWQDFPTFLSIYVEDADDLFKQAIKAGATVVTEMNDSKILGDRGGRIRDPFGNIWWIQTHLQDVSEEDVWEYFKDPREIAVMQNAQETFINVMNKYFLH
jgi:PhnB protein